MSRLRKCLAALALALVCAMGASGCFTSDDPTTLTLTFLCNNNDGGPSFYCMDSEYVFSGRVQLYYADNTEVYPGNGLPIDVGERAYTFDVPPGVYSYATWFYDGNGNVIYANSGLDAYGIPWALDVFEGMDNAYDTTSVPSGYTPPSNKQLVTVYLTTSGGPRSENLTYWGSLYDGSGNTVCEFAQVDDYNNKTVTMSGCYAPAGSYYYEFFGKSRSDKLWQNVTRTGDQYIVVEPSGRNEFDVVLGYVG